MQTELSRLLDAEETGKVLGGQHPRTILRLARTGQLPYVKLGYRTIRFKAEDVAAFIDAHRTSGSA